MTEAAAQREHVESADCWCEPLVYEPCMECQPFTGIDDEQKRDEAIRSALAVHLPVYGVTAARPARSKGCWKCGGDGMRKLDPGEPRVWGMIFHRQPKPTTTE